MAAVMRANIPACTLRTPATELSRRMSEEGVRSLVVASSGSDLVAGTVSDTDLLRALIGGQLEGMAADVMSMETPVTIPSSAALREAVARLQESRAEMLIVMGGEPERPVGVLTAGEVAAYVARQ